MTLQIQSIVLYNASGDVRQLDLQLGHVNIISGRSNTGKSALIPIIEYCLGSSEFAVPGEAIRSSVKFYGVLYVIQEMTIFVAKPAPPNDSNHQSRAYYEENPSVFPPRLEQLQPMTNDSEIKRRLSARIRGIDPGDLNAPPPSISISDSVYYLFQKSTVIAHDSLLFHRQELDAEQIRTTLPFALGIKRAEENRLQEEVIDARRTLRRLKDRLSEQRRQHDVFLINGRKLIEDAGSLGLVERDTSIAEIIDLRTIRTILGNIVSSWQPTEAPRVIDTRLTELNGELDTFDQEYDRLHTELHAAEMLIREANGYTEDAEQQRLRLQSIGILSDQDPLDFAESSTICPLCLSNFSDSSLDVARISAMRRALLKLEDDLSTVYQEQPYLTEYLQDIRSRLTEQKRVIERKQLEIAVVMRNQTISDNIAAEIRESNTRIDRLLGRIEFYLDMATTDPRDDLEKQIEAVQRTFDRLTLELEMLNSDDVRRRILGAISESMTQWAQQLNISYPGRYSLDIDRLTVLVDSERSSTSMQTMGGSANHLGCHLITMFSLHRSFIENKRPVPAFIFLDQPAQVYFPSYSRTIEAEQETDIRRAEDDDMLAVRNLFDFLFDVSQSLGGNIQTIVLEHARLDDVRFEQAVVAEFDDEGLVPSSWLPKMNSTQGDLGLFGDEK